MYSAHLMIILVSAVNTAADPAAAAPYHTRGSVFDIRRNENAFYYLNTGRITECFGHSLRESSLRATGGDNASWRRGSLEELQWREISVPWIRFLQWQARRHTNVLLA